ncbi:ATP-binding domain-containing protein [Pseudidiomarina sp. YC-516-91]|uniref:ATP-binding domain-containing protein n=1 Tax=Pseudidiomarina salilacus TaxID=3384452 RepID=UPI0039853A2B
MENKDFEQLANESLATFREIASTVREKLKENSGNTTDVFANSNSFTGAEAHKNLRVIKRDSREAYERLLREPAIARVVTEDQNGNEYTFYIGRRSTITLPSGTKFASYQSDVGRLAALSPGEEFKVRGITHYIKEIDSFQPRFDDDWDSVDTQYRNDNDDVYTIESLRALLPSDSSLDAWLSASDSDNVVIKGVKHQVLTSMELRDKPLLDRFQDEIHRLPLNNQLILLGPPGTGKTTTLIKRLSQKLNPDALTPQEESLVQRSHGEVAHEQSWIMFTPSDLLKHYLKEAFSREGVPASDDKVRTWTKYRDDLARNQFGILRSANGGTFKPSSSFESLTPNVVQKPEQWFEAFRDFHANRIRQQLNAGLEQLSKVSNEFGMELFEKLKSKLDNIEAKSLLAIYRDLAALESELLLRLAAVKEETDSLLKKEVNLTFNRNQAVFDDLKEFLLSIEPEVESDDDTFDNDDDEPADNDVTLTRRTVVNEYMKAIKSLSRVAAQGKKLGAKSRAKMIIDFLGDQVPSEESRRTIGRLMLVQNSIRRFTNSKKMFVTNVAQSYRDFRKALLKNNSFYFADKVDHQKITSTELDAIVLLLLRNARALLSESFVVRELDSSRFSFLRDIKSNFRNQVMVDEATDFSSLQLSCMYNLTSLETKSFFACGDFNQRITSEGIRSKKQLDWAATGIGERTINVVYRQSRKLNGFAKALLKSQHGDTKTAGELPGDSVHEGVEPALIETSSLTERLNWVAERVVEVERQVKKMPTTAVLVNDENLVEKTARELTERLEEYNLKAVACHQGQSLGEGTDVRVFDVQHIKGLEFEAVFFMDVDDLAERNPDLFDRYLYVGATRAATYLGLTCCNRLPEKLEPVRALFTDQWLEG